MLMYKNATIPRPYAREINYYFLHLLAGRMVFFYSIIVIYFRQFGLSFTAIMIISSIESLTSVVFEIPCGMLADRYGRRVVVFSGKILCFLAIIAYIIRPSFGFFLVAEVLLSIGSSCITGVTASLIYSKFKKSDSTEHYHDFQGFAMSRIFVANSIVGVLSTLLFDIHIYLPFFVTLAFITLSIIFLLFVGEEKGEYKAEGEAKGVVRPIVLHFKASLTAVLVNRQVLKLTLLSGLFGVITASILYVANAYLEQLGMGIRYLGIYLVAAGLVSAFFAKHSKKIYDRLKDKIYAVLLLTLAICSALLFFNNLILAALLLMIVRTVNAVLIPLFSDQINRRISDENRATTLSMIHVVQSGVFILADPLIGIAMDSFGMGAAYLLLGIIVLLITIFYLYGIVS